MNVTCWISDVLFARSVARWAAHQDPDADGTTTVTGVPEDAVAGQLIAAEVMDTEGIDLVARVLVPAVSPAGR